MQLLVYKSIELGYSKGMLLSIQRAIVSKVALHSFWFSDKELWGNDLQFPVLGIVSNVEMRPTCCNCISYWYCFFSSSYHKFSTLSCWWPHTRKVDIYLRRKCWHSKLSCLYITQLVTASLVLISKRKFLIWRLSSFIGHFILSKTAMS